MPSGAGDRTRQASRDRGDRGELVEVDVGALLADYFARRRRPAFDGEEVAHATGGDEERGFLFEKFGGALLQAIDGGVLAVDIVADFGFGHGAAHGGSWLCDGVAAKINGRESGHRRGSGARCRKLKKAILCPLEFCLVACFLRVK